MKKCIYLCALAISCSATLSVSAQRIATWLTNEDRSQLFAPQPVTVSFSPKAGGEPVITVNPDSSYQSIDGFGFALTGGSAQPIMKMDAKARAALLQELFGTRGREVGISYLRVSIGASDLNDHVFSYDDIPAGQSDSALAHFDLGPDKDNVIPVLQQVIKICPAIKILASPWSPPVWMKTNGDTRGGRLQPQYYGVYARYFVKYIEAMKAAGITIDAITVQNEPLHPGNNPSLLLTAPEEAQFIENDLGPAFQRAGIRTKIVLYDHNADRPDYPIFILDQPKAAKYVAGSGFHLYGGDISALTDVHNAHPEKNIYFTEQMVVDFGRQGKIYDSIMHIANPVKRLVIGATRNWSKNVLEWNLAADPAFKPYTDRGGCSSCQGAITLAGDSVSRNLAYYSIAHASKFVRPGSIRIASNEPDELPNVAFTTPAGKTVLVVANTAKKNQSFSIHYHGQYASLQLRAGSVATYVWNK